MSTPCEGANWAAEPPDCPLSSKADYLVKFVPIWEFFLDFQILGEKPIMKTIRRIFLAMVLGVISGSMLLIAESMADNMIWPVKSLYGYQVQVEFYSENRKHEWPGGGQAYALKDSRTHRFNLNCNAGEKICLGAWVTGNSSKYWGVGLNHRHSCRNCCYVCGGSNIPRQVLE